MFFSKTEASWVSKTSHYLHNIYLAGPISLMSTYKTEDINPRGSRARAVIGVYL